VAENAGPGESGRAGRSRSGRRTGASGTRPAILAAARARFAEYGYDGATIRAIASDAGVDPALVHHFYDNKERLFAAAMRLPVVPSEILGAALAPGARDPRLSLGEHLVRTALAIWETAGVLPTLLGLLRSALTSERAAAMLREFLMETILGPVAEFAAATNPAAAGQAPAPEAASGAEQPPGEWRSSGAEPASGAGHRAGVGAQYRAAMVASQMVGLALTRYVLALPPVTEANPDDLASTIGPTLDRYLTGDLGLTR
jgi:AcrR family transcriptional regulator